MKSASTSVLNFATVKTSGFMEWLLGVPSREQVETAFRQNLLYSPIDPKLSRTDRAGPSLSRLAAHPAMKGYDENLISPLFYSTVARNSDFIDYHPTLQAKIIKGTIDEVFGDKDWLGKVSSEAISREQQQDLILQGFYATLQDRTKVAGMSSVILPALAAILYLKRRQLDRKKVKVRVHAK